VVLARGDPEKSNGNPILLALQRYGRGRSMAFTSGKYYKFLSTLNQWQPQYGGSSATGGDFSANMGGGNDPDAIPTPSVAGNYKVTLNFKTGKYTVVKL